MGGSGDEDDPELHANLSHPNGHDMQTLWRLGAFSCHSVSPERLGLAKAFFPCFSGVCGPVEQLVPCGKDTGLWVYSALPWAAGKSGCHATCRMTLIL